MEPEAFAGTQVFGSAGYRGERFADVQPQRGAENGEKCREGYCRGVTDKEWQKVQGDGELRNEMLSDMQQKEETGSMAREKNGGCPCTSGRWQSLKPSYGNGWEDFPEENALPQLGAFPTWTDRLFGWGRRIWQQADSVFPGRRG